MTEKENGMSESYDEIADYILSKAADVHVMIGPLIELMYDGTKPAIPYVAVCTGDADGQMHVDQIMCHDEAGKFGLKLAIIQRRRPVVIHDMDDELYMAKMAAALWPCAKARRILAGTEKERAA
jgi:hypothetical protein